MNQEAFSTVVSEGVIGVEYYLLYAGGSLILISLLLILPTSKKKEKEITELFKNMEERLLDLKREIVRLKEDLKEKSEFTGGFKGYLQHEIGGYPRNTSSYRYTGQGEKTIKYRDIKRLLDEGYDEEIIAQQLQLGHRELHLIMKMKGWG